MSEINEDDCVNILKKVLNNQKFSLKNFFVKPFDHSSSAYLGDHHILEITYEIESKQQSERFFVKKLRNNDEFMRKSNKAYNIYAKESFFYTTFEPKIKKIWKNCDFSFVPTCFYSKDEIFVFEDLSKTGYCPAVCEKFDWDHMLLVLKSVAKLHAVSLAYEEYQKTTRGVTFRFGDFYKNILKEHMLMKDKNKTSWGSLFIQASAKGVGSLIDFLPEKYLSNREFKRKYRQLTENFYMVFKEDNGFRKVLCHGDLWVKNFLFKYENEKVIDCKVVDFQFVRYQPPAHDLTYIIYHDCNKNIREIYFDNFVNFYYEQLRTELASYNFNVSDILHFDQLEISCKYFLSSSKLLSCYYDSLFLKSVEYQSTLSKDEKDYLKLIYEDRSPIMKELFEKDEDYRNKMTEHLESIREIVIHDVLTIEDIHKIIRNCLKTENYKLSSSDFLPTLEKSRVVTEHYILKLQITCGEIKFSLNFFAKVLPKNMKGDVSHKTYGFLKEHYFFKHILPKLESEGINLNSCVPRCFHSRMYDVTVLENLKYFDYWSLDPRECLTRKVISLTLTKLAKLHAGVWVLENKLSKKFSKVYSIFDEYKEAFKESFYTEFSGNYLEAAKKGVVTEINMFFDESPNSKVSIDLLLSFSMSLYNNIKDYIKPSKTFRNTICHGDVWANNIMYKMNGKNYVDCKIVDFQTYRYAPPAMDLMLFIYCCTSRNFRKVYLEEILEEYYEKLALVLIEHELKVEDILQFSEFISSCNYYKTFAIAQSVIHFHSILLTPKQVSYLFSKEFASEEIFFKDRSKMIVRVCAEDEQYEESLRESIDDLRDLCESFL